MKPASIKAATAQRLASDILRAARAFPALRKRAGWRAPEKGWTVELALVSAAAMKKLNAFYRRKAYATDVLSFPAPAPFVEQGMLGELVICLPVLKRQAREAGHSEKRELEVLLVHGVLHLLGFDHERGERQAREQERWEKKLLGRVGLIARASGSEPAGRKPAKRAGLRPGASRGARRV